MRVEKQNYDFHDVDTAQHIARDGQSGTLELERAAQILDGEVDRLGDELDAARARVAELEAENAKLRTQRQYGLKTDRSTHLPGGMMSYSEGDALQDECELIEGDRLADEAQKRRESRQQEV